MRVKELILVQILTFFGSTSVFAENNALKESIVRSVEPLVALSIKNDPLLKELDEKISAEKQRAGARFVYPPLKVSYGFFILPIETAKGPQRQKLSVKQAIPWPGLATEMNEIPNVKADTFLPKKDLRIRKIRYDVEQLAWTYWHHRRQLELTKAHVILLDGLISSTISMNVIGRAPKSAVSLVTFEKGRISDRLENEQNNLAVTKVALEKWVGELPKIDIKPQVQKVTDFEISEHHPSLTLLERADALDQAKIRVEEKKDLPGFSFGLDYFEIGKKDSGEGGQDAMMARVGISLPIWSQPSTAETRALRGTIVARNFLRDEIKRNIKKKAKIEKLNTDNFIRKINYLEKTNIPLAEIYRTDLTAEYETGKANIQDIIQALNRVYRLQLKLADTQAKFEKSKSKLYFELGIAPGKK